MFHSDSNWIILLFTLLVVIGCDKNRVLFEQLDPRDTGLGFNNEIIDNDSFNILTYEYIYNGGGVAAADFDNDGLIDLFFTGNMVSNRLYLNEGEFNFSDITDEAGVGAPDFWCTGVAAIDINADGWEDIYVCTSTHQDPAFRRNLLFVNQGKDSDGNLTFREEAARYGVADTSYTTNAVFFDYDNDLDLDLFLIVNEIHDLGSPTKYKQKNLATKRVRVDRLYRNISSDSLPKPYFEDVSEEAGIDIAGYSLGVNITDVNQDGWRDIYISNDFISNDVLYINNQDGTFTDHAREYFKHTSHSAMGNDVADINNDGLMDIITLDMLPEDNYRRKTMMGPVNYMTYINNRNYGYDYQFVRNSLQLNQGYVPSHNGPIFSDVSLLAGIAATDWSWTPLVADFNHDGNRDLIITNGFPKDITDRDFTDYQADVYRYASKRLLLSKVPEVKLKNYAYKNNGDLQFENVTEQWGINLPSFSTGATYADLDNDGDLDYVVSNINDPAFIYKNLCIEQSVPNTHYLRIKLVGPKTNPHALGARVTLFAGGKVIAAEQNIYRGYLSTSEPILHFGLGGISSVDSISVLWSDMTHSSYLTIEADQELEIQYASSDRLQHKPMLPQEPKETLFEQRLDLAPETIIHRELDYVDFNVQPLLLHKLSQYGPPLAVGDVNGDGLSDLLIGGSGQQVSALLMQNSSGAFDIDSLEVGSDERSHETMGSLFFDADNDGDEDLYLVSGGYEYDISDKYYTDRFYRNVDGKLSLDESVIPDFQQSGSVVRSADFDKDGDLDLLIAGRVHPHEYPRPCSSLLLENKLEDGLLKFTISNSSIAPDLDDLGNVTDLVWTDFDADGWIDIIVVGEWMPVTLLRNVEGKFTDVTGQWNLSNQFGLWTCIVPGDLDQDGDIDYIVGNYGTNMIVKASSDHPIRMYTGDFDNNEGFDAIISAYFPDRDGTPREFPLHGKVDFSKQLNAIKSKFIYHSEYAVATMSEVLSTEQMSSATVMKANHMKSVFLENRDGQLHSHDLPWQAQVSPIFSGKVIADQDGGSTYLTLVGNDFGMELISGRNDALNGLVLRYDPEEGFYPVSTASSGFFVPGDAKSMVQLSIGDKEIWSVGQNQGDVLFFEKMRKGITIRLDAQDAVVKYSLGGKEMRVEAYYGMGFLSQSQRVISLPTSASDISVVTFRGEERFWKDERFIQ